MDDALVLHVRNDLSELARVADAVEVFGAARALPAQAVFDVNLALDEVLTNVISYAYDDDQAHEIEVRLALHAGELTVAIEDDGRAFDPLGVARADITQSVADRPIGGLGMHLVRRVMDGLAYQRVGNRNQLTLRKRTGGAR